MPDLLDDPQTDAPAEKTADQRLAEKDQYIEEQKKRIQELETNLRSGKSLEELTEELMTRIQTPKPTVETPITNRQDNGPKPDADAGNKVDLQSEVKKILEEERARSRVESNIDTSKKKLVELYGPDFKKAVEKAAQSLGVPTKFLNDLAGSSPDGFISVMKTHVPADKDIITPPVNQRGAEGTPHSVRKNAAYYRELRKTDLKTWMSKQIQKEMHKEALEQGPAFFQ